MDFVSSFLAATFLGYPAWAWVALIGIAIGLLALDLALKAKQDGDVGLDASLAMTAFHTAVGAGFAFVVWQLHTTVAPSAINDSSLVVSSDAKRAQVYLFAYVLAKIQVVESIFVIAVLSAYFELSRSVLHRLVIWGAVAVFLVPIGRTLIGATDSPWHPWLDYGVAAVLIAAGVIMWVFGSSVLGWRSGAQRPSSAKALDTTPGVTGSADNAQKPQPHFAILRLFATLVLVAFLLLVLARLLLASDLILLTYAVTSEPYIVYASIIFAAVGARALFFAVSALVRRFQYLKHSVAVIFVYTGAAFFLYPLVPNGTLPPMTDTIVFMTLIALGVFYSVWKERGVAAATSDM